MSDIEWSPWIERTMEVCPVDACMTVSVKSTDGQVVDDRAAGDWGWKDYGGRPAEITHYRIPMADYKRIHGVADTPAEEKKVYAMAPEGCWNCLTPGKVYAADGDGMKGFDFVGDTGVENYAKWICSAHLNGGDWTRLELTEAEAAEINARVEGEQPMTDHDTVNAPITGHAAGFLEAALGHMEDRASTYDAEGGERSMGKTVSAFNAISGHELSEEQGWLFMVLLKAVRTQQGGFRADNYEDGAAYFGLQGEAAASSRKACAD